jgi:hypothetical protein
MWNLSRGVIRVIDAVEERREDLEALAERDDLNCSKYAEALLRAADSNG